MTGGNARPVRGVSRETDAKVKGTAPPVGALGGLGRDRTGATDARRRPAFTNRGLRHFCNTGLARTFFPKEPANAMMRVVVRCSREPRCPAQLEMRTMWLMTITIAVALRA